MILGNYVEMYVLGDVICEICRHSIDAFQPPSRAVGSQTKTPMDTILPNILRPSYNDLRSADDTAEADEDGEEQGSSSQVA